MTGTHARRAAASDWAALAAADDEPWPGADGDLLRASWDPGEPFVAELYERAARVTPPALMDWSADDAVRRMTPEQRVGVAYWLAMHGIFESAGILTFAHALLRVTEAGEQAGVRRMLMSISRDENHHDEMAARACAAVLPGFPHAYRPATPLEYAALRNLAWVESSVSRYWASYQRAAASRPIQLVLAAFATGEGAATGIFGGMAADTTVPVLARMLGSVARDEARHFAFAGHLLQRYVPEFDAGERALLGRNLAASFVYFSVLLDEPDPAFWGDLPDSWLPWHRRLESLAREAGLALADMPARRAHWRRALLTVKAVTDRHDVPFPAIPRLGIDGESVALRPDDVAALCL